VISSTTRFRRDVAAEVRAVKLDTSHAGVPGGLRGAYIHIRLICKLV
jgi:hypothetical protein